MIRSANKNLGQSGIAMMMTLVTMLLLSILAAELVYQNQVYTGIVFRTRDQLRARLLARSALRIGLLQLRAAEKAKAQLKTLGLGEELANKIWQTPLILPPPVPPGMSMIDSDTLNTFKKALGIDGTMTITISGTSDRLDLNQLVRASKAAAAKNAAGGAGGGGGGSGKDGQPIESLSTVSAEELKKARDRTRKAYADILDQILEKKRQDDDAFREKYSLLKGDTLIANLLAFMDPETKVDGDNRDKADYYTSAQPTPYSLKDAPLVSPTELYMVKGFDDTLVNLLLSHFTTETTSSVDVNKASASLLQALIPEFNNEDLDRLVKRRDDVNEGGPFKDANDFWNYLKNLDTRYDDAKQRLTDAGIQLLGGDTSYRVMVSAESGVAYKNWIANVGATPALSDADSAEAKNQAKQNPPSIDQPIRETESGENKTTTAKTKNSSDSIRIIYLKAD